MDKLKQKKRWYEVKDVHERTGLAKKTIARWFREGRVDGAFKVGLSKKGGRWLADGESINKCLRDHGWTGEAPF